VIVDEMGFLKKRSHSAGVKCQHSGAAGRIENSYAGVYSSATPATVARRWWIARSTFRERVGQGTVI
jgi:SRSO17 transposase